MLSRCSFPKCTTFTIGGLCVEHDTAPRPVYTRGFAEYLPNAQGRTERVRASDGVHFETAGGRIIAREVLRALNKAYDLTSWRATD